MDTINLLTKIEVIATKEMLSITSIMFDNSIPYGVIAITKDKKLCFYSMNQIRLIFLPKESENN